MRQIVLDTETTGLEPAEGHRVIEIGCVELINRRRTDNRYRQFLNPGRAIDSGAVEVHGITNEMLADKPRFQDIAKDLLDYIRGAELVIHNATFDVGFLNNELALMAGAATPLRIEEICAVVDTLALARGLHPGQKNDLDSLCRRYSVDNSTRTLHGALLDAEILADVYLAMTGGQTGLFEDPRGPAIAGAPMPEIRRLDPNRPRLPVIAASAEESAAHQAWLEDIEKQSGGKCVWKQLESPNTRQ